MVTHHIPVFFYLKIDYLKINNDIMTLYSKWFDTHSEYEAYKNSQNYILPNVSICYNDLDVHYEKEFNPYNGHEYVDLGLPSGTLWAKCNVGAEAETEYGLYFQWGDTQGYTADQVGTDKAFTWNDYKYGSYDLTDTINYGMTKYNATDGETVLDLEDDAAHVNMGGEWRIPTKEQFLELADTEYVTHERIVNYNNSGVTGFLFTSVANGNTMFVPHAGYVIDSQFNNTNTSSDIWFQNIYFETQPVQKYRYDEATKGVLNARGNVLPNGYIQRNYGLSVRGVIG